MRHKHNVYITLQTQISSAAAAEYSNYKRIVFQRAFRPSDNATCVVVVVIAATTSKSVTARVVHTLDEFRREHNANVVTHCAKKNRARIR